MVINTSNVTGAVPLFSTGARGAVTVPESTVPAGATTATAATSLTLIVTSADATSLAVTRSPVSMVVQRTAKGPPRRTALHSAKATVWDKPAARSVTVRWST